MIDLTFTALVGVVVVGAGIGFLGGLLGKGGSAVATPVLVALGIPPIIALAAPLPATVPSTLIAAHRYRAAGFINKVVLRWSLIAGVPATIVGALATRWVDASSLVLVTDVLIVGIGIRMLLSARRPQTSEVESATSATSAPAASVALQATDTGLDRNRTIAVAVVTGLAAGLLANSGGFLLAPLFIAVLGLGIRPALGTSLAAASVLAVPGTLVHFAMGHLDLMVVAAFALGSIPLASVGARVAMRTDALRLERGYGLALVVMGVGFFASSLL